MRFNCLKLELSYVTSNCNFLSNIELIFFLFQVYESKDSHKLNEVLDIIGFLSLDPLHSAVHDSEDYMDDMEIQTHHPPASMVPRLHAIKIVPLAKSEIINDPQIMSKAECIRGDLQMVLGQVLFGDQLAADYLICHLISSMWVPVAE